MHNTLTITTSEWVDINTSSGIEEGTAVLVQNKGGAWVRLYESDTPPTPSSEHGRLLTSVTGYYPTTNFSQESLKIWAKSVGNYSTEIYITTIGAEPTPEPLGAFSWVGGFTWS